MDQSAMNRQYINGYIVYSLQYINGLVSTSLQYIIAIINGLVSTSSTHNGKLLSLGLLPSVMGEVAILFSPSPTNFQF